MRRLISAARVTCSILVLLIGLASVSFDVRPAAAATADCTAATLRAAAPAGMKIGDIANLGVRGAPKTVEGVALVTANARGDNTPEYCLVTGTVLTNAKTGKTANFAAALPAKAAWNGKFMFQGCGGNCGRTLANVGAALIRRGYPIFATDGGHGDKSEAQAGFGGEAWAVVAPGKPNDDALTDFFYRATHTVVDAGKGLTLAYYGSPKLTFSYFNGCSDGGRDGLVEIDRYPTDFDGVIAGDPYFDIAGEAVNSIVGIQAQLRSTKAALTPDLLNQVNLAVTANCDAADGVVDGLIQNPAKCTFNPQKDLPTCGPALTSHCFTRDQLDALSIIFSAITDPSGKFVYPGYPVSNPNDTLRRWMGVATAPDQLAGPEPWTNPAGRPAGWGYGNGTLRYLHYADQPGFNALVSLGVTFQRGGPGPITSLHAVIPADTVIKLNRATSAGNGNDPAAAAEFIRQGRKLILYNGFSDGDISSYGTTRYYRELAKLHGGFASLQKNARLFMVPGMGHCGGGPSPNEFGASGSKGADDGPDRNLIAALEAWVEHGRPPQSIIATQYEQDDPKRVLRTMPLCPFPAMAQYSGKGSVNDAANWTCSSTDQRLLQTGYSGHQAGVDANLN